MNTPDMSIQNAQNIDQLFQVWRSSRPDYECFSNDGVLVDEAWQDADIKIAFILKESNDDFCEIRGKSHGPCGNSGRFWRNLSMWRFITEKVRNGEGCSLEDTLAEKEKPLTGVAYINLKKNAECNPISDDGNIQGYVERDWPFLVRQIEIIKPDVLFCCGTFKYIRHHFDLVSLGERVFKSKDMIFVDFFHPSAPNKSDKGNFELLSRILKVDDHAA
ncbi:MAG: hypothetical protein ABSF10_20030 [Verrucomicrobiota bacterium]|jgi:hypothetical protein